MKRRWKAYVAAGIAIVAGFTAFFQALAQTQGNFVIAILLALLVAYAIKVAYSFVARRLKWPDYTHSDFLSDIISSIWW